MPMSQGKHVLEKIAAHRHFGPSLWWHLGLFSDWLLHQMFDGKLETATDKKFGATIQNDSVVHHPFCLILHTMSREWKQAASISIFGVCTQEVLLRAALWMAVCFVLNNSSCLRFESAVEHDAIDDVTIKIESGKILQALFALNFSF